MKAYPLIRYRFSNEHIMSVLFIIILMYMFPLWIKAPSDIPAFVALLSVSLILDATAAYIRHRRFVCSVSAAVTAAILHIITPGIPLWCKLIGIFTAIVAAKQIWGGTGKNTMNPAIVGYLVTSLFFAGRDMPIEPSVLLIPALLLSLPFILFRPFVTLGYFIGMLVAYFTVDISSWQILLVNSIFFGSIVITDPVTVTPQKSAGFIGGFLIALIPILTEDPAITFSLMLLIFNLISYLIDDYFSIARRTLFYYPVPVRNPFANVNLDRPFINLSGDRIIEEQGREELELLDKLTPEMVLERIEANAVYGLGGGGFPTAEKIKTVLSSNVNKKFLIINAAECDPGLIHDKWLLRERSEDIYKGIRALSKCTSFSEIFLAVKNTKGFSFPDDVKVHKARNYYPVGFEKTLIENVIDRKVPVDFIPAKLGILVLNVQTVLAVYEAVFHNRKTDAKYITVANLKTGTAEVVRVKTGQRIVDILEAVYPNGYTVYVGGGIMQAHMAEEDEIVNKDTNFIAVSDIPRYKESMLCSNCNACTTSCPQGLIVQRIAELVDNKKYENVKKYRPENCINCGLCSYVSLCGKNLSARVGEAKQIVLKRNISG